MPKIRMPARSYYDRTHEVKGTMDMGLLYPVLCEEVNPGDTFEDSVEGLIRAEPMLKPVMHEINAYIRAFFVRDWTIMDEFESMISAGPDGESTDEVPFNPAVTVAEGSLADWLRINPGVYPADYFSMLPVRGYNKIFNDHYRDQNTMPDEVDLDSFDMQRVTWERDFHTSGLPWAQRGPQVMMPLGVSAPVISDGLVPTMTSASGDLTNRGLSNSQVSGLNAVTLAGSTSGSTQLLHWGNQTGLKADLSSVSGIAMNAWRQYLQVQAWMELNALGGVRYPELVLAHFGVVTPDARLDRAEYLGGVKVPIVVSEVLQTSQTSQDSPQGNLSGHGIGAAMRKLMSKRSFTEHGWLYVLMSIVPRSGYQQGIPLEYFRKTHLDFTWPLFTRLGMREVPIKSLFTGVYLKDGQVVSPDTPGAVWTPVSDPDKTFNYQTIYNELRFKTNSVHGKMRSSLSYWHLNRIFAVEPVFNNEFVTCNPSKRIFEVPSEPAFDVQIIHHLHAIRELPKDPTPWHF